MVRTGILTLLVAVALGACSGSLSADEYFGEVEDAAKTFAEAVDDIDRAYAAALDETIAEFVDSGAAAEDEAAFGELAATAAMQATVALGSTGIALEQYGRTLSDLQPPQAAQAEHDEMVASLAAALAAVPPTVTLLASVTSVDDLGPAVAGSPFSDTLPRLERACSALEAAGSASGNPVDLRCVSPEESDAP